MEGFNNQQGASNRDVEGIKGEGIAMAAAEAEGEADAHTMHMCTHLEAFPNMFPDGRTSAKLYAQFHVLAIAGRQTTGRGGRQNPAYSNQYKIFNN